MKRAWIYIALVLQIIILLTGCGDVETTSPTTTIKPTNMTTVPSTTTTTPTQPSVIVGDSFLITDEDWQMLTDMEIIKVFYYGFVSYGNDQPATLDQALKPYLLSYSYLLIENGHTYLWKTVRYDIDEDSETFVKTAGGWYMPDAWLADRWSRLTSYAKEPQKYFDFPFTVEETYCCQDGHISFIYYKTNQGNYFLYTYDEGTGYYHSDLYLIPEDVFQQIAIKAVEKLNSTAETGVAGYIAHAASVWDLTPYKVIPKQ